MTVSSPQLTLLLLANTKHVPISYTEQMSTTVVQEFSVWYQVGRYHLMLLFFVAGNFKLHNNVAFAYSQSSVHLDYSLCCNSYSKWDSLDISDVFTYL